MFEKWQICVHLIIETNSLREINKTQISKKINLYKYTSHNSPVQVKNSVSVFRDRDSDRDRDKKNREKNCISLGAINIDRDRGRDRDVR